MFTYEPLMITLIRNKMRRSDLRKAIGLGPNTIAKLGADQYVSMEVLDKICNYLNCDITDVVRHVPDDQISE